MTMTQHQERTIARYMYALSVLLEGQAATRNSIQYLAVTGWNPVQVGERCRLIDAHGCDGVVAVFDPATIEKGPLIVGVSIADAGLLRLELGTLWTGKQGPTVLLTAGERSHLRVDQGRFVETPGVPARDLTRGKARACRRLSKFAAEGRARIGVLVAA